jgi:hypothetical protein
VTADRPEKKWAGVPFRPIANTGAGLQGDRLTLRQTPPHTWEKYRKSLIGTPAPLSFILLPQTKPNSGTPPGLCGCLKISKKFSDTPLQKEEPD